MLDNTRRLLRTRSYASAYTGGYHNPAWNRGLIHFPELFATIRRAVPHEPTI